jgi:hypothetical protein
MDDDLKLAEQGGSPPTKTSHRANPTFGGKKQFSRKGKKGAAGTEKGLIKILRLNNYPGKRDLQPR